MSSRRSAGLSAGEFLWIPGRGHDPEAVSRMQKHFKRPAKPMGEAWFMGPKRRMFEELMADLDQLSADQLMDPLEAIASGTSSFGQMEEWNSWYHHLLGRLISRNHEYSIEFLLEYLVTAFITQYPDGLFQEPYRGFAEDALNTLGKCIMDEQCWDGENIRIGRVLRTSNNNPNRIWRWWDASGDFSASMFFCLKYLPAHAIPGWLESALAIKSPHWRAQLLVWLVGAHGILENRIQQPAQWGTNDRPSVEWAWSHCLTGKYDGEHKGEKFAGSNLIPEENRHAAWRVIDGQISEDLYIEWLDSISVVDYLEAELAEIPKTFAQLYIE